MTLDALGAILLIPTISAALLAILPGYMLAGYHKGDGLSQNYEVTWGTKHNRLSIFANASFAQQDGILSSERSVSPLVGLMMARPSLLRWLVQKLLLLEAPGFCPNNSAS